MKNINETVKSKYLIYILFLAGGLLLGWLLFHNSDTDSHTSQASETGTEVHDPTHGHDLQQNEAGEWTCSMHPQIRQDKPGKCRRAMDLILYVRAPSPTRPSIPTPFSFRKKQQP